MSDYRDESLVTAALQMALGQRIVDHDAGDLIHHTDRGSQCTAGHYLALLQSYHITVSMSRKGDCYDNAMMESFFSTLRVRIGDIDLSVRIHRAG
jgi:putative transposase